MISGRVNAKLVWKWTAESVWRAVSHRNRRDVDTSFHLRCTTFRFVRRIIAFCLLNALKQNWRRMRTDALLIDRRRGGRLFCSVFTWTAVVRWKPSGRISAFANAASSQPEINCERVARRLIYDEICSRHQPLVSRLPLRTTSSPAPNGNAGVSGRPEKWPPFKSRHQHLGLIGANRSLRRPFSQWLSLCNAPVSLRLVCTASRAQLEHFFTNFYLKWNSAFVNSGRYWKNVTHRPSISFEFK